MANDDEDNEILAAMENVLAPLGKERTAQVLAWAKEHMAKVPLIAYMRAEGESRDVPDYQFRIAQPNPIDPENTVFAIFHWFVQGFAVVYSFKTMMLEDGGAATVYTRDVIFKPRFISGPVTLDALHADLGYHLNQTPWDDVDEPEDDEPEGKS